MAKVSVIVPVYNVEKYLKQCLDSIVDQTLEDLEIVLVDDGSVDSVGQFVMNMQKKIHEYGLFIRRMVAFRMREMPG